MKIGCFSFGFTLFSAPVVRLPHEDVCCWCLQQLWSLSVPGFSKTTCTSHFFCCIFPLFRANLQESLRQQLRSRSQGQLGRREMTAAEGENDVELFYKQKNTMKRL